MHLYSGCTLAEMMAKKKKKKKNSGEGVRFALYLCQEWFHTP